VTKNNVNRQFTL